MAKVKDEKGLGRVARFLKQGVCPECGQNRNEGPCSCRKKPDPRLAVLEQLLDK